MLSHTGYMEAPDDHAFAQNEIASAEQQPENVLFNSFSIGTQALESQITQNGCQKSVNPFLQPVQNELAKTLNPFAFCPTTTVNGFSPTTTNPFYTQGKDSSGSTVSSDINKDLMLTHGQSNGWSYFPTFSTPSLENGWAVFPPPTFSQETNTPTFPSQQWDIFRYSAGKSNQKRTISQPFNEETSVSQKTMANEKTSDGRDYLLEYMLANQKNPEEPIPSTRASNQNELDTFKNLFTFPSPITSDNVTPASQPSDTFQTSKSSVQSRVFQTIQLFQTPASVQDDLVLNNGQFRAQDSQDDKMFMPLETSTMPSPLNALKNGELLFRRRPPKPTPRIKALKHPNLSTDHAIFSTSTVSVPDNKKPEQTLFTSSPPTPISIRAVPRVTTNIQNTMLADEVNQRQVYEDVLFIGQEKCVEDWPEDSPVHNPDWKPSGKLKLRRESMRIAQESEAAINAHSLGKKSGKTKLSLRVSRKGSKVKSGHDSRVLQTGTDRRESEVNYPDDLNGVYGDTMPSETKLHAADDLFLPKQEDQNVKIKRKSSIKTKFVVPRLQYKGTKKKSLGEVFENGSLPLQASKSEQTQESYEDWLRNSEQKKPVLKDGRLKEPLKFKPSLSHRLSKDAIEDDLMKMNGLSFFEESKENMSERAEKEKHRLSADLLAEYQHEPFSSRSLDNSEKRQELQDRRPKRSIKFTIPHLHRKGSKSTLENDIPQKGDLFKASDIKGLEIHAFEDYSEMRKSPEQRISPIIQRDSKGLNMTEKGADLFKAGDIADDNWMDKYTMDSKTEKKITCLAISESKAEDQVCFSEDIEPPGATSGDYYLSEAAKAEWMSSQMDVRRVRAPDEDTELNEVKEEEEGDTDSLMEWWNTVELWDELPPDEEISVKEDETKSFTEIADKVHRGLRVFHKVFTEQAEVLYLHVLRLYAIGEDFSNFHRRTKIANITGGTTTAVGGVAAIAGLALAPVTFGASLIVSAVGLGVATAGGITAASASISDNFHDMNDRKKIEVVVQDYDTRLAELRSCLCFVGEGVRRLRFHPLLRRNNYYAGDWEVRRALQTISLVGDPVEQAEDIVEKSTIALNRVCKGMDSYFSKDSKELKKGCKKEVTMQVNMLAKLLHENLVALNSIREQLMQAIGQD